MVRALYCRSTFTYGAHCTQNIVCNVHVPDAFSIDIMRMYSEKNSQCTYQPKIFPGLIFRPSCSPIVLLIFKSSRIIVTGARTYADILSGFAEIFEVLRPYFTQCVSGEAAEAAAGTQVVATAESAGVLG
jgi:TATA-box binding protein (TBP) (component of TFIID and TFIIIB)